MKAESRGYLLAVPVVIAVVLWAWFGAGPSAQERARRRRCHTGLKVLTWALHRYAGDVGSEDSGWILPPTLGYVYPAYVIDSYGGFLCPSVGKATVLGYSNYTPARFGDTHTDYVYVSGLRLTDPADYVLVFDDEWNHDGDGVNAAHIGPDYASVANLADVRWWDIMALHEQLATQEKELAAQGRKMKLLRPAWSSWPDPPAGGRPWYTRRSGRAIAVGVFVALAVALALVVRKARRGRTPHGS